MTKFNLRGKKKVTFRFQTEKGKDVFVAGTFNNWQPAMTKLKGNGSGVYTATLQLPEGRYEYKFVVEDVWHLDPPNPETVPNDCGSMNNVIIVE